MTETTHEPGPADLTVTAPAAYQGYQPAETHQLPSGAVFKLRRPQIMKMLRRGLIPNPLMEIVNAVFEERDETELTVMAEERGVTVDELRQELDQRKIEEGEPPSPPKVSLKGFTATDGLAFTDVVVWAAIVEPEVEFEPQDGDSPLTRNGTLAFDAISDEDHAYILAYANQGIEGIARFRGDLGREGDGSDSGEVRSEAERPAASAA